MPKVLIEICFILEDKTKTKTYDSQDVRICVYFQLASSNTKIPPDHSVFIKLKMPLGFTYFSINAFIYPSTKSTTPICF